MEYRQGECKMGSGCVRNPSVTGGHIQLRGFSLPYGCLMLTVRGTLAPQRLLPDSFCLS